jgi:hypothetical protein
VWAWVAPPAGDPATSATVTTPTTTTSLENN